MRTLPERPTVALQGMMTAPWENLPDQGRSSARAFCRERVHAVDFANQDKK
jgi:hypothetical protein